MKWIAVLLVFALLAVGVYFIVRNGLIEPDPTLEPLVIVENAMPFGTVQPLATPQPTPTPEPTASPTPDTWTSSDQSTWQDWTLDDAPTATPRTAATAAPDAQSWNTSTEDYNAGYPVLRVGSTGSDVSDLQARLVELGYMTTITGKYDTDTHDAVAEFQTRNGLASDGIAGRQTQDLLYSSSAQPKAISVSTPSTEYILLKRGASGLDVRKLQGRLAELGYYAGGVDGIYGESTETAVKTFQRNNGLSGDGQAGKLTQEKLYSADANYADNPVATADPNTTRTMTLGMTGNDVYAMQARLIELRYLTGVADGVFGQETQDALIAFQKNNNLTADGNAGPATIKKLNGSARAASSATAAPTNGTLREGDSGDQVYLLQAMLFELGYYDGRIDGRFGSGTTEAVKAFQRANGLGADGIAGKGTLGRLQSDDAVSAAQVTPAPTASPTPPPGQALSTLRRGDNNDQVRVLQQYLISLGYLSGSADGNFGSGTERALKLFQEANGLTADGVAGPGTQSILFSSDAKPAGSSSGGTASQPSATATPKPNTDIVIQWESEGDDVRQYQQRLYELGYLTQKNVTGKFNQPTVDATKAFQTMHGLKVDGAAGPQTLKLIYSDDALRADGTPVGDLPGASDAMVADVLKAGMSGDQVRQLQNRLAELGYLSASFVSGTYDTATQQAVRRFQTANGLTADGDAGQSTQSRLYASGVVTAQVARMQGDNSARENEEYRLNGAYQTSIAGGGIAAGDRNDLYAADISQGGVLTRRAFSGGGATVLANDVPRFLHLTNGRLYYVASDGGEDCVIRMNADGTNREVLCRAGVVLKFMLHDGVMFLLDANATLKERTLSGEESELMGGVADFALDVDGNRLLCITDAGVVAFGIATGKAETLYTGAADQAIMCGQALLVRTGGSVVRVSGGTSATIRRDGATCIGTHEQRVIQLTSRGVISCDVNGENATTLIGGEYENMAIVGDVLYLGTSKGYTQSINL